MSDTCRARAAARAAAAGSLLWATLAAPGPALAATPPATSVAIESDLAPATHPPATPDLLALGKRTFEKQCAACHGPKGDGQGEAAYLLYPKPRNFVRAKFRIVTTWDGVPKDEDLFRTISRGMPGSAMPSWAHLPEKTRWALVHYVKSLAESPLEIQKDHQPQSESDLPSGRIAVPPEPADTPASRARGQELFRTSCAGCHGPKGLGDGPQQQIDSEGIPIRPRNLTLGVFKGSPDPQSLFCRVVAGLPGSPMPAQPFYYGDDAWHLVHFVRSLSSDEQRSRAEMKRFRVVATRVDALPEHPDDGIWRTTPAIDLHLMPLWWREDRPEILTVQALHDGKRIAIQLAWSDATHDHTAVRPQDFRDAAAVEFSLDRDPPFFAMGEAAHAVNIWMWKSERQADLEPAFQDLEKVYPNLGIDAYPNLLRSALEQPTRNALTLQSDPTYVTGWGAGNIVSDPTRQSAAEDLRAQGFGTLRARPPVDQQVQAMGVYGTGSYRVVFLRSLAGKGASGVNMRPGDTIPVAFAVWNGSAGDRDGKKSVSIWQELVIAR